MSPELAKYLSRAVPRYTSYPTAPHFSDAVTGSDYRRWLRRLDPCEPVSLYLHVPYCKQACWYCGCNMKLAARPEPVADYAATLMQEISLVAQHLPARMRISHLHWGGGTPTALSPADLECAMEVVHAHFDFTNDAEIAIESDPRTLTEEMTARIGAMGFNRASFGVQEFDPKVQAAINRIQPADMVRRAVDGLRAVGVSNINFDLIYGLPHQTTQTLIDTIALSAGMRPDRIALFGYAHVPWMAKKQRLIDDAALPRAAARLEQAAAAAQALEAAGYVPIGLDHFARPGDPLALAARAGTLRRNFQGYTTDTANTLIGVGATSIGRTPSGYVQNIAETGAWGRAVATGNLPIAKGVALTASDKLRGAVIEALMCNGHVDLLELGQAHGARPDWADDDLARLSELVADGFVEIDGTHVTVRPQARPLLRIVASAFDAYLPRRAARHSVAV